GAGHGRRAPAARARDEGVGGGRALAGTRTRTGHGPRRRRACAPVLARLVRQRHQDLHDHVRPARRRRRTRPLEIWVCADGYWADHTKNLVVGELKAEYAELEEQVM